MEGLATRFFCFPGSMSRRTARGFCFTINNPDGDDLRRVAALAETPGVIAAAAGEETAPTTGTSHVQGFVSFDAKRRALDVAAILPRAHVRPVRNPRAAFRYCLKGGRTIVRKIADP